MLFYPGIVLAKTETTYGIDSTPTNSDAILAGNVRISRPYRIKLRGVRGRTLSKLRHFIAERYAETTFLVEISGTGISPTQASDLVPIWDTLIKACGFKRTDASASPWWVQYSPISANETPSSCTLYVWRGNHRHILTGCRGQIRFYGVLGEPMYMEFKMTGLKGDINDVTMPDFGGTIITPPQLMSGNFWGIGEGGVGQGGIGGIHGASAKYGDWITPISEIELAWENEINVIPAIDSQVGVFSIEITDRNVNGKINPLVVALSEQNPWTDYETGLFAAFTLSLGNEIGNEMLFSCPSCVLKDLAYQDRNGVMAYDMPFGIYTGGNNDQLTLKLM